MRQVPSYFRIHLLYNSTAERKGMFSAYGELPGQHFGYLLKHQQEKDGSFVALVVLFRYTF